MGITLLAAECGDLISHLTEYWKIKKTKLFKETDPCKADKVCGFLSSEQ